MAAQTSPISKSDFIRAQPASLSVAQVIAKGQAEGIKFGSSLVYMVRRPAKKKKPKMVVAPARKPTASPTSNAKPRPSKSARAKTASKADFVRARAHLSSKEIVEDAKSEGLKLDVRYVYNVRGTDKAARKRKRAAAKTTTSTPTVNGTGASVTTLPATTSSSAEDLLKAVAAELGLGRAVEILAGERARVRAVFNLDFALAVEVGLV
jgi:hypothetical protein